MINLLPPEFKQGYTYARRNVALRKWLVSLVLVLVGLGALGTYGLLTLHQSTLSYKRDAADIQGQLEKEHVTQTKQQVEEMSNSLKLTVKVLSNEVLFSKLIKQIGAAMPNGAVLSGLKISTTDNALDLSASATNYTTATQVQVNLADPKNQIFSKADIININCSGQSGEGSINTSYPCQVSMRALFGSNSPFLFINQGKTK